ncbi:hypothetical protein FA95DRAFT_1481607 [Auriscalpium vulgare]|uniref:Uncharacterized protein n=1 Tax=Auriscalpium vulgare TaxID=40419 RepID=A0ACB8SA81_9AGAM|nr:hypothetical protein FA95DRAFT_1481607 [Auriscalpium vulgare]
MAAVETPAKSLPTSTFSFTAPFPSTSTTKQRRASLALSASARQVPEWTFRDDTALESRKGKMRKLASGEPAPEKKMRKKWSEEETQMLVEGCNRHGVGNWKAILHDPTLIFDHRSPVDLKDRFRTYFPDAYKQHYPNAKTHLSSKVRSALPDGTSIFEKTRSKKRRPFTEEEDRALKAGYDKHGTVWATIVKDPIFQEQNRRSTDLRDRFRNAFPELYQAAGYKPRNSASARKKSGAGVRAATDEQIHAARETGPARRKRRYTTQGFLRGGTKSVPLSPTVSDEEDSSGDDEEEDTPFKTSMSSSVPELVDTPSEEMQAPSMESFEVEMQGLDPLSMSDFMPSSSQSLSEMTDSSTSQTWSTLDTPVHSTATWSTSNAAGSPASPHDFLLDSPYMRRNGGGGLNLIGKSAWGTSDWLSANPRLESASPSYYSGMSPTPSSPASFSFAALNHNVLDRYDLFPSHSHGYGHDLASSDAGRAESYSALSDPEMGMAPSAFRGFTHHSTYAGDLIFGARTHQPDYGTGLAFGLNGFGGLGFGAGAGTGGLGLSGTSIHPMQMHTPALPGIDEIELTSINLNDGDPVISATDSMDTEDKPHAVEDFSTVRLPMQTADEISGLLQHDLIDTPPGTPVRSHRGMPAHGHTLQHNRSLSVPPPEHRFLHTANFHTSPVHAPLTPTRSLSLELGAQAQGVVEPWRVGPSDFNDLPFLDLHYYGVTGTDGEPPVQAETRTGRALDLAQPQVQAQKPYGNSMAPLLPQEPVFRAPAGAVGPAGPLVGRERMHHRGMSAVSPQDLLLRKGGDNKRKRASWDGGPR